MPQDPNDMTNLFNTALSPADETKYQAWAKKLGAQGNTYDYDLRGAWKSGAKAAANGHFTDEFKKPNHPTFSDESMYSTPMTPGGHWEQQADKSYTFTPSDYQLKSTGPDDIQSYFASAEPGNKLILPPKSPEEAMSRALAHLLGQQ